MKKIGILLLIVCLFGQSLYASVGSTEFDATTEPTKDLSAEVNSAIASGSYSLDALNPLLGTEKLVDNARSAIIYESNSQTLLYAWNPDVQMYPASFVKIMTALLAIQKGKVEDIVTVNQTAINAIPHDAVSANLVPDEKLSLEELLYCLLVGSANDAAAVIAEHISGAQSAFIDEMNRYALELGCTATHFTNVHGLHDDNQHTTARDCAKILDIALKNPIFKTVFTASEYTVQPTNLSLARKLISGNSMMDTTSKLYYDSRVIGGRTGVTQDGRRCLAAAAESNGMLVVSIVMGAESVYKEDGYTAVRIGGYKETTQLLDACLEGYKAAQILRAEQILRQIPIDGAENDLLVAPQSSVLTVLPFDITVDDLAFHYSDKDITLPISKGQYVSDVQIWHGTTCVGQVQLFAMNSVYPAGYNQAVDPGATSQSLSNALWIIFGIVAFVAVIYLWIRFSGKIKSILIRVRARRYRKGHKRNK